jgi:hypothetical protein
MDLIISSKGHNSPSARARFAQTSSTLLFNWVPAFRKASISFIAIVEGGLRCRLWKSWRNSC